VTKDTSAKNSSAKTNTGAETPSQVFRAPIGTHDDPVDVADIPTDATPIGPRSKAEAEEAMAALGERLAAQQEMLFARGIAGDARSVLLVLQGMDTAGKDGVIKHVVGLVDPGGISLVSFKKPTEEELAHDFLWRIEKQVPGPGRLGVFNRSQYEDVLIVRVHQLVRESVWAARYAQINDFEQRLVDGHTTLIKCFLHVSRAEQTERLLARLEDPTKYWKYNPGDVDERGHWDDYQRAYSAAIGNCNTDAAPWYVIPSDRKWYRNWAVAALLLEKFEELDLSYPPAGFDVEVEKRRVRNS
jgi:PPK2 family polyphosphate:nucleotide phosphotransferase